MGCTNQQQVSSIGLGGSEKPQLPCLPWVKCHVPSLPCMCPLPASESTTTNQNPVSSPSSTSSIGSPAFACITSTGHTQRPHTTVSGVRLLARARAVFNGFKGKGFGPTLH